jgi:subtilisin family serine protease
MRLPTLCLLSLLAAGAASAWTTGGTPYVEGQILVRFGEDVKDEAEARQWLADDRCEPARALAPSLGIWLVELKEGLSVEQALAELAGNRALRWAQADHKLQWRQTFPNDPMWSSQWDLHNTGQGGGTPDADIDAPEAWDLGTGGLDGNGDPIVVAIVDGGMELTHSNLAPNLWVNAAEAAGTPGVDDDGNGYVDDINGWDAYAGDGSIPSNGHGTHVAGTVGARGNDGSQVTGINWNVKLMAVAASSGTTSIAVAGYNYVLVQKTRWLQTGGASGANVVATNSSFGVDLANCASGSYPAWNDVYNAMGQVGILSAAATANANYNVDVQGDVPTGCSSDWLVTVTNTTNTDVKYNGAGYGATTIDLGAPGTSVLSTYTGNGTSTLTGTSMATPHVAGAIGFLHSVASPGFTAEYNADPAGAALTLKQIILDTTDPKPSLQGITVSGGRLNLFNAALELSTYGGGLLEGVVSSQASGDPLAGALVVASPGNRSTTSNAQGAYILALQPGDYLLSFSAYGHQTAELPLTMPAEGGATLNAALAAAPMATLSGVLLGGDGLPLAGGEIEIQGAPLPSQITDGSGGFSFQVPLGQEVALISRTAPGELHDPQEADAHGYRAFDPGDADWSRTVLTLAGDQVVTLRGANRAVYAWTTISPEQGGPGTALVYTSDDQTQTIALPFPFTYYGQVFTTLSVCGNGWLALGATTSTEYRGQAIPTAAQPNAVLAPFWEDLSPQQAASGEISTWHDVADGRFIVEFFDIRQYTPATDFERFQAILFDPAQHPTVTGDGAILFQYAQVGETDNTTVGIEDPAGAVGLQYYYGRGNGVNTPGGILPSTNPALAPGLALLFTTGLLPVEAGLGPVTDLAIAVQTGQVALDWSPVAGATAYRVESAPVLGGAWTGAGVVGAPGWSGPAPADGQRIYRVIAMN